MNLPSLLKSLAGAAFIWLVPFTLSFAATDNAPRPLIDGPYKVLISASHYNLKGRANLGRNTPYFIFYKFSPEENSYQATQQNAGEWHILIEHLKKGTTTRVYLHVVTPDGGMSRDVKVIIRRRS